MHNMQVRVLPTVSTMAQWPQQSASGGAAGLLVGPSVSSAGCHHPASPTSLALLKVSDVHGQGPSNSVSSSRSWPPFCNSQTTRPTKSVLWGLALWVRFRSFLDYINIKLISITDSNPRWRITLWILIIEINNDYVIKITTGLARKETQQTWVWEENCPTWVHVLMSLSRSTRLWHIFQLLMNVFETNSSC